MMTAAGTRFRAADSRGPKKPAATPAYSPPAHPEDVTNDNSPSTVNDLSIAMPAPHAPTSGSIVVIAQQAAVQDGTSRSCDRQRRGISAGKPLSSSPTMAVLIPLSLGRDSSLAATPD